MHSGCKLLLVACTLLAGCNRSDDEGAVPADSLQVAENAEAITTLLAPLRAVSRAEVEFGELAAQRAAAVPIRDYARTVAADHRAVLTLLDRTAEQRSAVLSEEGPALEMANMVRMAHSGLENLNGPDFDLPYMRAEVESHRQLLDRLDQQAIPAATTEELRTMLTDLRAMTDAHLTRARQLLATQLGETAEPRPASRPQRPVAPPRPPDSTPRRPDTTVIGPPPDTVPSLL